MFLLPCRGTPAAPRFNGTPSDLARFLADIADLSDQVGLPNSSRIKLAIRYVDLDDAELWETIPEATASPPDWAAFVLALISLYPGCNPNTWTIAGTDSTTTIPPLMPSETTTVELPPLSPLFPTSLLLSPTLPVRL